MVAKNQNPQTPAKLDASVLASLKAELAKPEFRAASISRSTVNGKTWTLANVEPKTWTELPAQANCILQALVALGGSATSHQLAGELVKVEGYASKQEPMRILMYYRKRLVKNGFVA